MAAANQHQLRHLNTQDKTYGLGSTWLSHDSFAQFSNESGVKSIRCHWTCRVASIRPERLEMTDSNWSETKLHNDWWRQLNFYPHTFGKTDNEISLMTIFKYLLFSSWSRTWVFYPAGAAAGYCIWLVSLPCRRSRRVLYLTRFFILPAQPQDLVSYSFLSSFFFFFFFFLLLLATRVFHTFPYILFWPNLVTMTGTLTTTQAQKMVGSGVTMGSLGSKRSFAPKRHQVLQIT